MAVIVDQIADREMRVLGNLVYSALRGLASPHCALPAVAPANWACHAQRGS